MGPLIIPAAVEIAKLIPSVMGLFGAKPEEAATAQKIVDTVTPVVEKFQGVEDPPLEDVIEAVRTQPAVRAELERRILIDKDEWMALAKVDADERRLARDFAVATADKPMLATPAFIISIILIVAAVAMTALVLVDDAFNSETRTLVIQAVIGMALTAVGFWLGTSHSSQVKTDVLTSNKKTP
jgi:hypothetical protein